MNIFEVLNKNAKMFPERVILEDELYGSYNFAYIEDASARVYSYLENINIGKEDIVVIRMKRSARIFIAMLGIWKAGASFVVIGEHSPEKYVKKVLEDVENKLIIDDIRFEEILDCFAKSGYRPVDKHDLACLIYSTGSSGFFKGSMHEYGAIELVMEKFDAANLKPLFLTMEEQTRNVMFYPLYSIDSILELLFVIYLGNYYYVVPYRVIYDFSEYAEILNRKQIEIICVSSNNYRRIKQYDLPYLKRIDLSLDANIDELDEDCEYTNTYALTEAFGWVTSGYIEKKIYDVVPSGKPCPLTEVKICDKNGAKLNNGIIGEILVYNEYFRGYRNYPELTAKTHKNGWIHTGDIGYVDNDGNYVVLGRKIDMIETEDGYIIPTLISAQIKKCFPDIVKSYIKLFQTEEIIKICVFYCGSNTYSIDEFNSVLSGNLPQYMLPTHCIKKDDFRYFDYGKIDRLSFEEPN